MYFYKPSKVNVKNKKNEADYGEFSPKKFRSLKNFTLKNNEKIFYKFIIPGEYKSKILKKSYLDGYSEEYLFPGYKGVADAMKNRIVLEKVDSD